MLRGALSVLDGKFMTVAKRLTSCKPSTSFRRIGLAFRGNDRKVWPWTQRVYDTLIAIQWGTIPDPLGWMVAV
jgi:hypothetical protein